MFGEVLEAFDGTKAQASDERENGVAKGSEGLGCLGRGGTAGVLAAGHVADVMQAVLDAPMVARQLQQAGGGSLGAPQAGDSIDGLDALLVADRAAAFEAADLLHARPGDEMAVEARRALQAPDLDAAMSLVSRFDGGQIRRRRLLG
jgi:hypothetical protein